MGLGFDKGSAVCRRVALLAALTAAWATAATAAVAHPKQPTACPHANRAPRQATMHFLRSTVLCLVNRVRLHHGLEGLSYSSQLRASATAHSRDMVVHKYFSHYGPGGRSPFTRVRRAGYPAGESDAMVGENLGWGFGARRGSPKAMVRSWMRSPEHRANILEPRFRDFGVGVSRGSPFGTLGLAGTYTLDFGRR